MMRKACCTSFRLTGLPSSLDSMAAVILVPYIYGDIYHEETQQLAVEDPTAARAFLRLSPRFIMIATLIFFPPRGGPLSSTRWRW